MSALLLNPSMYVEDSEVSEINFNVVALFETSDIWVLAVIAIIVFVIVFILKED